VKVLERAGLVERTVQGREHRLRLPRHRHLDPRVGGGFRIVVEGPTYGAVEHHGEYLAIEPPSLLSLTWISEHTDHKPTVVTIEFHERGTGTELVLTHRRLPPKAVEAHRQGWTDIVRLIDEALTRG
jgi:uncharacterized protein YndB with AHSA1/START domain